MFAKVCICQLCFTLCTYAQQSYAFGCISLCMYKNWLFSTLRLENILLSVFYYFLTEFNASSVACFIQRAVQIEQFVLFQVIKMQLRPLPWLQNINFLLSLNGTPHPLG